MAADFLKAIYILDSNVFKLFTGFWFLTFPQVIFFKFVCISYRSPRRRKGIFLLSVFLTKWMLTRNSSPWTLFSARLKWRGPSRWDRCEHFSTQLKKFLLRFGFFVNIWSSFWAVDLWHRVLGERKQELIWTDRSPNTAGFSGRLKVQVQARS